MKPLVPVVRAAVLACVFVGAAASHASAGTYNFTTVDAGTTYGPNGDTPATPFGISGIAGTSGDFNQINDYGANGVTTFNGVADSTGSTAANVSITLTNFYNNDTAYQHYDPSVPGETNNFDSGLFGHFDYSWAPNSGMSTAPLTSTITLNNLTANSEYQVVLYGYNGNGDTYYEGRNFEVAGSGSSTNYLLEDTAASAFQSTFDSGSSTSSLQAYAGNYLTLDALTDASGTLTLNFTAQDNFYQTSDISGLQVASIPAPVPEPSTWALLGLGGVALLAIRHRRRA